MYIVPDLGRVETMIPGDFSMLGGGEDRVLESGEWVWIEYFNAFFTKVF